MKEAAASIVRRLHEAGHTTYFAGGCVRDMVRGVESKERLGRHRWVVERTHSWMNRFRRLKIRYERRAEVHIAFLGLGCALICWRSIQHGLC
jgi:IS5 family transposase